MHYQSQSNSPQPVTIEQPQQQNLFKSKQQKHSKNSSAPSSSDDKSNAQIQSESNSQSSQMMIKNKQYELIIDNINQRNQKLIINLRPHDSIYHQGVIISSNSTNHQKADPYNGLIKLFQTLGFKRKNIFQQIINTELIENYFIITKNQPFNGKILTIDSLIWKQQFYFNLQHILTINFSDQCYVIRAHPQLKYLSAIEVKPEIKPEHKFPLSVTLQSYKNTSIIQKYLVSQQHLYLPNAQILAMSSTIKCQMSQQTKLHRFSGPGWIFFSPSSTYGTQKNWILLLNMFIFLIILYIIASILLI